MKEEIMSGTAIIIIIIAVILVIWLLGQSIRTVRPTSRGLVERFGKYNRFANPGIIFLIPFIERLVRVNITENMIDAGLQEIITSDSLNAQVDAQVYFKVRSDEESVKASQYNVFNYMVQIVALARTTLRNIIGTMTLKDANSERGKINSALYNNLASETKNWGLEIVRTELKEINPPTDVQETMNKVVKASNEKIAAIDFATARETQADGERRAAIKVAEAADLYFKGNAQLLRQLQAVETSLASNSKIVVPTDSSLVNVIGGLAGIDGTPNQPKNPTMK
jgi:regulator of protease activity HflC (stomatin/prohibitin superfamily)